MPMMIPALPVTAMMKYWSATKKHWSIEAAYSAQTPSRASVVYKTVEQRGKVREYCDFLFVCIASLFWDCSDVKLPKNDIHKFCIWYHHGLFKPRIKYMLGLIDFGLSVCLSNHNVDLDLYGIETAYLDKLNISQGEMVISTV